MPIEPRYDTKWWGWGAERHRPQLGEAARSLLRAEFGDLKPQMPVELGAIELPPARDVPVEVKSCVEPGALRTGLEDRVRHAAGKSYPDLISLRSGQLDSAPDAVIFPSDATQLKALLEACAARGVAVVPFGGGTSVVGGVDPYRGGFDALISIDLSGLRQVAVDRHSLTARLGPGLRGPDAERALASEGVTLGHFPQSFEFATIGGFAATRSAGQASSGYGRFDEIVTALRMISPAGEIATLETPHTAAGPSLRELVLGSEGTLGIISEVTTRVRPAPRERCYEGWMASDFPAGSEIIRTLAQHEALPDITRLSDAEETRLSLGIGGPSGAARRLFDSYLRLRGKSDGCMLITGWEGERESVRRRRALSARVLRSAGAASLGQTAGRSWEKGRYEGPYLRDALLDSGLFVETLETSHTWTRLDELYREVGGALGEAMRAQGSPGVVLCHLSHAYADGASLYFTFMAARRPGAEIEQWRAVKTAACEAIVRTGGTITHHHAVGRDHAPYMKAEIGALGIDVLRAAKERLDPAGIMNPGKLLPAST